MEYNRYNLSRTYIKKHPHLQSVSRCWQTTDGIYHILYDEIDGYKHLRIIRRDNKSIHNYMDLQQIKNDLLGDDAIAIEVFPKSKDFINGSNTYHLWSWDNISVPNLSKLYQYNV